MFRRGQRRTHDFGRVVDRAWIDADGVAQFVELVTPYEDAPSLRLLLGAIATQPLLDVVLAAGLTWAAHSSVAIVLLVMSFAAKGVVPPDAAFALVLGANLGPAINPVLEGADGDGSRRPPRAVGQSGSIAARRRGAGVLALLGRSAMAGRPSSPTPPARSPTCTPPSTSCWPLCSSRSSGRYAALLRRYAAGPGRSGRPVRPLYLDRVRRAKLRPSRLARRRGRRCGWPTCWRRCWSARGTLSRRRIASRSRETKRMDDVLDRLNRAIKAYLTAPRPRRTEEADHRRIERNPRLRDATWNRPGTSWTETCCAHRRQAAEAEHLASREQGEANCAAIIDRLIANCAPRHRCS